MPSPLRPLQGIAESRVRLGVPGIALAVFRDGRGEVLSDGLRDVEHALPYEAATPQPIASASKAFTAALIGTLVDEGLVGWDEPVRRYLPALELQDADATQRLSIRDMLSHRSGLPHAEDVLAQQQSRAAVVASLRDIAPTGGFRETWQYTNHLYVAAAHVAETVLGTTWEQAIQARLLDPLGMTGSSPGLLADGQSARGYGRADGGGLVLRPEEPLGVIGPAGGIVASATDLLAWLEFSVHGGMVGGRRVLSESSTGELQKVAVRIQEFPAPDEARPIGYGMGWLIEDFRGHVRVSHAGGTFGFASFVGVLPEVGAGVAVLANLEGTPLVQILANEVCDDLLGLQPLPWSDVYDQLRRRLGVSA